MSLKQELFNQCLEQINARIKKIGKAIEDIQLALESETKSSAGDKHETGRAMLHLERENVGQQLHEAEQQKQILMKVNPQLKHESVGFGTVVKTSLNNYFLAVSAGPLKIGATVYYAISIETPIAQLLKGKQRGDSFEFSGEQFQIKELQ